MAVDLSVYYNVKKSICARLVIGFGVVSIILAVSILSTKYMLNDISNISERIISLRVPTAATSAGLVNDINSSLASLRGYMLTGKDVFKVERTSVWDDIDTLSLDMEMFSQSWTNPDNVKKLAEMTSLIEEFRIAQQQVEDIAHSVDQYPANKILLQQAAPKAAILMQEITKMIDNEMTLEATAERKNLLGVMADVRGSTAIGLANIRAYLLSGDVKFKNGFDKAWAKNKRRFADLKGQSSLFSAEQVQAFKKFSAARTEFAPLPPQMFEIRGSDKWNMANYTLVTEAAPRANKILTILAGPKEEDGSRHGGMVANQKKLLESDAKQTSADIRNLLNTLLVLLAAGLIASIVIVRLTGRSIIRPIKDTTDVMTIMSNGEYNVDIPGINRVDEVGTMSKALEVFKENAIERLKLEEENKKEQAAKIKRAELVDSLINGFDESSSDLLNGLASAATEMEATSKSMTDLAGQTTERSSTVAAAAEQAGANVQSVASAAEEMSASVQEIRTQIQQSANSTKTASESVQNTARTIEELSQAAEKINEVVSLITDIAEQTNLLALNATIEAARAGDAGKGFAVVASEVKNLAAQTAKATEEISGVISKVQEGTKEAVIAIKEVSEIITGVSDASSDIAMSMDQQASATQEISENVQEASTGTSEVTENINAVSSAASESGRSASEVLEVAQQVAERSNNMKNTVEKFLKEIKAA